MTPSENLLDREREEAERELKDDPGRRTGAKYHVLRSKPLLRRFPLIPIKIGTGMTNVCVGR